MPAFIDLTGRRFGKLKAIGYRGSGKYSCLCDCGTRKIVAANHLRRGATRSCGCLRREVSYERLRLGGESHPSFKHGRATQFSGATPSYRSWKSMIQRCTNQNNPNWPRYGGRGITVSPRWLGEHGFQNFLQDMGERPKGQTLDRINPDGNYCRSNCRWSTAKEQANNRHCRGCLKKVLKKAA